MKIYLDSCCLNRPYDDLSQNVVRMEAEAVIVIIDKCENGDWDLYSSDVLLDELDNIPDLVRKCKVHMLYQSAKHHVALTSAIVFRAKELAEFGIKPYDALHLASAESADIDILLTTDRKLIRAASKSDVKINVRNPLIWLTEVLYEK